MPDVLLFGATGYTGRLTAAALSEHSIPFVACGRDPTRLQEVAAATGAAEVRTAAVGDVDGLVRALHGIRVMISCVGPFLRYGATAIEAAVRAGVHYTDSTGEAPFIQQLIERDDDFRSAGIVVAPAMGLDEVPADVAASLATDGMGPASLDVTYAMPRTPSTGTLLTTLPFFRHPAHFIAGGRTVEVRVGERSRWAPLPSPLGPRRAISFPLGECRLAPLHIDLRDLGTYVTAGRSERWGIRVLSSPLGELLKARAAEVLVQKVAGRGRGPDEAARRGARWTILAEARDAGSWRNVVVTGVDPYGLTAELLATAAGIMRQDGYGLVGVASPVQALGRETLQKTLIDNDVDIQVHEPRD